MKTFAFCVLAAASALAATPSMAEIRYETGPQPVTVYNVCNYDAVFVVNTQAKRLRGGGEVLTVTGDTATVTQSPSVFLQTRHLVRNAYQSLSTGGC